MQREVERELQQEGEREVRPSSPVGRRGYGFWVTETLDQEAVRSRRRRLAIIIGVIGVLLTAALVWGKRTNESLDRAADSAKTELRELWRPVDLRTLNSDSASAVVGASDSGNYGSALRLLPQVERSTFLSAQFVRGDVVDAKYAVRASGRERCLLVRVEGPAPNRVLFKQTARC